MRGVSTEYVAVSGFQFFQDTAFIDSSGTDVVCKRGKNIPVFAVFFI